MLVAAKRRASVSLLAHGRFSFYRGHNSRPWPVWQVSGSTASPVLVDIRVERFPDHRAHASQFARHPLLQ